MQFGASEAILHWGLYRPASPAVLSNGRVVSFRELNDLINRLVTSVQSVNTKSDRIAIAATSKLDFLVSLVAVLRSGKSAVLLNTGLTDEAIKTNVDDTGVSVLIHDKRYERLAEVSGAVEMMTISIEESLKGLSGTSVQPIYRGPGDEWGVLFSSGTTGTPKGIERDHDSMVTEFLGWCLELGLNRHSKFYIGRPIFYTGGLVLAMAALLVGGEIIINDFENYNDPIEVWKDFQNTLDTTEMDWAFFVPDQIRAFIKLAEKVDVKAASTIVIMGAPISGKEKITAAETLKSKIVESWGNSESLGTITDPEDLTARPDSIGRPFLTDELYVVNEDCDVLAPNEIGKIAGGEEAGFSKYSNRPEETEIAKRKHLIVSEDIGYVDEDAYFYVCGRQQDCVVIGGETVFIPRIEEKIRPHQAIKECCVCATGDETSPELVVIVVSSNGSLHEDNLLPSINDLLGKNEKLARVLIVESIPHVPSGKPNRVAISKIVEKS